MGGLQAKSIRHSVTEPSQDGGYVLLWQRYDNNKMVAMRYYGNVFYIFNSTVIDWTCFLSWHHSPYLPGPPQCRGFTITHKNTTLLRTISGLVTSPTQRPQPDNTQHSKETDIHAPGGIQTCNPGHWYQPTYWQYNCMSCLSKSTSNSEVQTLHQKSVCELLKWNFKTVCVKCATLAER